MKKLLYILILFLIYGCTNITHKMAELPMLIPLPSNRVPVKIEDVVSEDPSWEYNNINDNGLHEIYVSSQEYRTGDIKVGYY